MAIDKDLETYKEYLRKKAENPDYVPNVDEETSVYKVEHDQVKYYDLDKQLAESETVQDELNVTEGFVKDDIEKSEIVPEEQALKNPEEFDQILEEEMRLSGISGNNMEIKNKIVDYVNNPDKLEEIQNEQEKEFYYKMEEQYKKQRDLGLDNKKVNKMVYTNPDLNNNGYANLIFISILIAVLAFVIFLSL